MGDVVLAVLAHEQRACLEDLLGNLAALAPSARVVLFNGGSDAELTVGLGPPTCPYSRPMDHHRVGAFHGLVMQWLSEEQLLGDHLVTLDSDVLMLRQGLPEYLGRTMTAGYRGAHLGEIRPDTAWRPGRRFLRKWPGAWQDLFGVPYPYRAFNPVQVFSRTYVDAFISWPGRHRLMRAVEQTRLDALDEIVWPTLAAALGVGMQEDPGGHALQLRRHTPAELGQLASDPDVYFVHKVGMELAATDRRLVRSLASGVTVDWAAQVADYDAELDRPSPARRAAALCKDVYQALVPAERSART